ncbi:lysine--tRNA ligase [Actinomadura sp. ATCC 31491]|uniref:Lysine--tRNA ligase n=1 Tax=Actinomadura luzonensis TaxID=2805427 RepID=A0ABT0FRI6_9ACTN|nr:lysine--tRNA ligase [Actinomadura luzonensis]MCK2214528.1 lysine--tRNA ligase [Actinomadura luzonensis]
MVERGEGDWVSRFADEVISEAERRGTGKPIVCASGLSPSGPIHLGNLREIMTPHFVADELRRRGVPCVHLLSWDDYDRFRRVPAGVDPSWAEHIGKPLTAVPAPPGSPHPNWAEHFKAPMIEAMDALGVRCRMISQTEQYTSGAYREQILLAVRERAAIDAVLSRHRSRQVEDYFPYKPYCELCGRDLTTVTAYDDESTELAYTCECGFGETVRLAEHDRGKLVWKVDWPMRWAYEGVLFEPSGVDHHSPGSAWTVGGRIVGEVFGGERPIGPMYAFVGITGMAKMSSSKGDVPTPSDALEIMEAPVLRWLYARRKPAQSFKIAFDQEIHRLYDEWDALGRKIAAGQGQPAELAAHDRAVTTAEGPLALTPHPVPYRTLASIADITTGHGEQILRILRDLDGIGDLDAARPRLDRAARWVELHLPPDQRTRVREEPDEELLDSLGPDERESLRLLADGLDDWSPDGLTALVYGVPKLRAGLPADAPATPELKAAQRAFFVLLYRLLVGRDTGPRLPTLLLAVGAGRVRKLVGA